MKMTIKLTFNKIEAELLTEAVAKSGYSAQELLRMGLRLIHEQEIGTAKTRQKKVPLANVPPAIEVQGPFKMQDKDYCENVLGGTVTEQEGKQFCTYKIGACEITDSLDTIQG